MNEQLDEKLRSDLSAEMKKVNPPSTLRYQPKTRGFLASGRVLRVANLLALSLVLLVGVGIWQLSSGSLLPAAPIIEPVRAPDSFLQFQGWELGFAFSYPAAWRLTRSQDLRMPDDPAFARLTDLEFATRTEASDRLSAFELDDVHVSVRFLELHNNTPRFLEGPVRVLANKFDSMQFLYGLPDLADATTSALTNHDGRLLSAENNLDIPYFQQSRLIVFESTDHAYTTTAYEPAPAREVVYFTGNHERTNVTLTAFAAPGQGTQVADQIIKLLRSLHEETDVSTSQSVLQLFGEHTFTYPSNWVEVPLEALWNSADTTDSTVVIHSSTNPESLPPLGGQLFIVNGADTMREVPLQAGQAIITLIETPFPASLNPLNEESTLSLDIYEQYLMDAIVVPSTSFEVNGNPGNWGVYLSESVILEAETAEIDPVTGGTLLPQERQPMPPEEQVVVEARLGASKVTLSGRVPVGEGEALVPVLLQVLSSAESTQR